MGRNDADIALKSWLIEFQSRSFKIRPFTPP